MKLRWLLLVPVLFGSGCAEQVRIGTDQMRSTISGILEDQALNNAAQAYHHPMAVPNQIRLTSSVTTAQNSVNAGIPTIALRAIGITAFTASSQNNISQNWTANPISGYLDVKLLEMFYNYATDQSSHRTFDEFEQEMDKVLYFKPGNNDNNAADNSGDKSKKASSTPKKEVPPISVQIGSLPSAGFIKINDPANCPGGVEKTVYYTNFGDRVCFQRVRICKSKSETDYEEAHPIPNAVQQYGEPCSYIEPSDLLGLFVMWSIAIPDLTAPETGPTKRGSSPRGIPLISTQTGVPLLQ